MQIEWLIPAIFLLVWIINSIVRGSDDDRAAKKARPVPPRDRQSGDRPARRPTTDIDRFLDEVNRRRRQAVERQPARAATAGPPTVPTVNRPRPVPRSQSRGTPAAPPVRVPVARTIRQPATVIEPPSVIEIEAVASVARPVESRSFASEPPAAFVPATLSGDTPATGLAQAVNLLVTPGSLRAAVILHEILGPPLARRRGSR